MILLLRKSEAMYIDKLMEKIKRSKKELAEAYNTDESKVAYIGNNKYIVVLSDGKDVRV
jgi:hypothetical protein